MSKPVISAIRRLPKVPTGIRGLDEITAGGLPKGRTTLVCGSAGCGKTLMGTEFLIRGAAEYDEPGVFMAFEETKEKLAANCASLGFDLDRLIARKKLVVDYVHVERSEIEETGEYDLGGLFARLNHHIRSIGAKRVLLDTVEVLFSGLKNEGIIRSELRRLFRWLEERKVTTVLTGERGEGQLTRHGLEEYVSDCVILLDHRVSEQLSTRRLRIVKYRGSSHGTNEYPFLIDQEGISVLPVTSLGLAHEAGTGRVGTGVPELDGMLGGKGFFRGSTVLISGTAGTGKTSLGASFAVESCRRGDRTLYFSMEESPRQLARNMSSIGLSLDPWIRKGLLEVHSTRPTLYGMESHLVALHKTIDRFGARAVVVDPVTGLLDAGNVAETRSLLIRLVDLLKGRGITAVLTSLTSAGAFEEDSEVGISSLIDTWINLSDNRVNAERNRTLQLIKSRGMAHSNQIREFLLTDCGIRLLDVYLGPGGLLTGSARVAQEASDREAEASRILQSERQEIDLVAEERTLGAQMAALKARSAALANERRRVSRIGAERERRAAKRLRELSASRRVNGGASRGR